MNKSFITHITALLLLIGIVGCNSSDDPEIVEFQWADVAVNTFKLTRNDSVLAGLDSVFFAIDLDNARIYNPDSLPKGTRIDKMVMTITYATVKKAELLYRTDEGVDSIRDYTGATTDTVSFSNGPVILRLTSLDESVVRDYKITINVHEMEPDSLAWGDIAYATLPESVAGQRTIAYGEHLYQYMVDNGGNLSVAELDTLGTPAFGTAVTTQMGKLPAGYNLSTLSMLNDKVYVAAAGRLMCYDAPGQWSDTGVAMTWVYGEYDGYLLGCRQTESGAYELCSWPVGINCNLNTSFPVSETPEMIVYTSEWTTKPMALLVGGRKADGVPTGATWAFDGTEWQPLCTDQLPDAAGMTVVPYYTTRVNTRWVVTQRSALLAFGGRLENDSCQRSLYVSYDRGFHWFKGQQLMQLPDYISPTSGGQALVVSQTKYVDNSRSGQAWTPCELAPLPRWLRVANADIHMSRATEPLTQWSCPYIYMIGGVTDDGAFNHQIWRGVINRLSFVPLY